jgi:hypothetical protein
MAIRQRTKSARAPVNIPACHPNDNNLLIIHPLSLAFSPHAFPFSSGGRSGARRVDGRSLFLHHRRRGPRLSQPNPFATAITNKLATHIFKASFQLLMCDLFITVS